MEYWRPDTGHKAILSLYGELGENRTMFKSVLRDRGTEFKGHLGYLDNSKPCSTSTFSHLLKSYIQTL